MISKFLKFYLLLVLIFPAQVVVATNLECLGIHENLQRANLSESQRVALRAFFEEKRLERQTIMKELNRRSLKELETAPSHQKLDVLSFNTGLLWNRFVSKARVPDVELRAPHIAKALEEFIVSKDSPVLFLQELWHQRHRDLILDVANKHDMTYIPADPSSGLVVLVKKNIGQVEVLDFIPARRSFGETVVGIRKGLQPIQINLQNGKRLLLINAHFAYSSDSIVLRQDQVRQLHELLDSVNHDYVVFGGDLNSSDRFLFPKEEARSPFLFDREVYLNLVQKGFIDSYAAVRNDPGFSQDPYQNPLAYYGPTTGTEPAQRLDYVMTMASAINHVAVISSQLRFNEARRDSNGNVLRSANYGRSVLDRQTFAALSLPPQNDSGGPLFLSDHFAVESSIALF